MARNTRLATTVTARYVPSVGAVDAFYLDGRISGQREEQFADITLDREDRGAFFAVYASSRDSRSDAHNEDGNRQYLDQITNDLKRNNRRNIDYEINELAECVVNVSGRLTLADAAIRQPYFAGIIVKDGEMAAITLGRGVAYLYRDDALYPLTQDEFPMEAIDANGRKVGNMKDFAAGIAGTIRYSNIAQLKQDDCIIMCNKEVIETIGQRQMLRILDEAEDQCEAAGVVMDIASRENPHVSMQFMIGFVEDIVNIDRLGRSTLARGFTSRITDRQGNKDAAPLFSGFDEPIKPSNTVSADKRADAAFGAAAAGAAVSSHTTADARDNSGFHTDSNGFDNTDDFDAQSHGDSGYQRDNEAGVEDAHAAYSGEEAEFESAGYDESIFYNFANTNTSNDGFIDEANSDQYNDQLPVSNEEIDYAGFGHVNQAAPFDGDDSINAFYVNPATESYGGNESDAEADHYDDTLYADSFGDSDRNKKIAVAALAVVAVVLLFFIVKTLVTGDSNQTTTTPSFNAGVPTESSEDLGDTTTDGVTGDTSVSVTDEPTEPNETTTLETTEATTTVEPTTEATTIAPTTQAPTTAAPTTAAPTTEAPTTAAPTTAAPTTFPSTYTVQEGDTLFTIAERLYGDASYMNAIAELNNLTIVNDVVIVQAGSVLNLPQP